MGRADDVVLMEFSKKPRFRVNCRQRKRVFQQFPTAFLEIASHRLPLPPHPFGSFVILQAPNTRTCTPSSNVRTPSLTSPTPSCLPRTLPFRWLRGNRTPCFFSPGKSFNGTSGSSREDRASLFIVDRSFRNVAPTLSSRHFVRGVKVNIRDNERSDGPLSRRAKRKEPESLI